MAADLLGETRSTHGSGFAQAAAVECDYNTASRGTSLGAGHATMPTMDVP